MRKIARKKERRRHSRKPISKIVPILWEDENGHEQLLQGRLIDVSLKGARMWLPVRLPARAMVCFNCPELALGGRGTVRYSNAAKGGYEVGLELSNGTGWRDSSKDLQNLAAALEQPSPAREPSEATETRSRVAPKNR
jgi:hypothetical protein